jgi:hypothetical protein
MKSTISINIKMMALQNELIGFFTAHKRSQRPWNNGSWLILSVAPLGSTLAQAAKFQLWVTQWRFGPLICELHGCWLLLAAQKCSRARRFLRGLQFGCRRRLLNYCRPPHGKLTCSQDETQKAFFDLCLLAVGNLFEFLKRVCISLVSHPLYIVAI